MKLLLVLFVAFSLFLTAAAQENSGAAETEWRRVETENKEFSVSLPPNFIVNAEKGARDQRYHIVGFQNGVTIELKIFDDPDPRRRLRNARFPGKKVTEFSMPGFEGKRAQPAADEDFSEIIHLATKKTYYQLNISAETGNEPEINRALQSITTNGARLFEQQKTSNVGEKIVVINTLSTSAEAAEALARKPSKSKPNVFYKRANEKPVVSPPSIFSRPIIILEKPNPTFRPPINEIIAGGRSYSAKLVVTFLASGEIGDITVYSDSNRAYIRSCVEAVRRIKFIPAQISGKNADATQAVDYTLLTMVVAAPGIMPF
jgi:hypothetical protein